MRRTMLAALALVMVALLLFSGGAPSRAQEVGTISGTVVNGTAGGGATAGLPVTLTIIDNNGTSQPAKQQTTTDEAGSFVFEQVPLSADTSYQLSAVYAGVEYAGDVGSLASAEGLADQTLDVYETTSDPAVMRASMAHVVIQVDKGSNSLLVSELLVINNTGDRAYIGQPFQQANPALGDSHPDIGNETMRFAVPAGASNVGIVDGLLVEDLVTSDFGFSDTSPWLPGTRQVAFSYSLPYQGSDYVFRTALDIPADTVNILMPKGEAKLESGSPFTQDETVLQEEPYLRARADNLEAGATIQAILTDLPSGGSGSGVQTAIFVALIAAALGVLAVVAYSLFRRSRLAAVGVEDAGDREKAGLLLAIAELDRQHDAGQISEAEYNRRRAEAKSRLEAIW
jgi:hypothetical protein